MREERSATLSSADRAHRAQSNGQPLAVICGGGDLNTLRALGRSGIPALVASADPHDFAFRSRYCRERRVISSVRTPEQMIEDLVRLGREFAEPPVLFYGDDPTLLAVSRHRERLLPFYRFLMPEREMVEQMVGKVEFAHLARRYDLLAPRTITSAEAVSPEEVRKHISVPCILKPSLRVGWFQSQAVMDEGGMPQKVLRADTWEEFDRLFAKIKLFSDEFVIQEYIPGGDDCIYSFHAYYDRRSEPLAYFVGRKIRTYPKDAGISTYLELVDEPEVAEMGREILRRLNFVGPVKIDFKKDAARGGYRMLEINARFTLWSYLGSVCGANLPQAAYEDLTGRSVRLQTPHRTGVRWLSLGNDLRAFIRDYRRSGDLGWSDWISSLRAPKVYDIFSWSDPAPSIVYAKNYLRKALGKYAAQSSKLLKLGATGGGERLRGEKADR